MNKLSPTSYRALFFKHVFRFLGHVLNPAELAGSHVIAVSGGLDSMSLLWLASQLRKQEKIGRVRAVFVHHHTRPGQDFDAEVIKEFCHLLGIPFDILHAQGLDALMGNFESRARGIRRTLLLQNLRSREILWMGHHLDDSYEWSIMQRSRSNQPKSTLGIPVRNGPIVRPFLCVTREQLKTLSQNEKIIFREDPTNQDTRFDRNYVRKEIAPRIRKRYPKYLKHYAFHANYMATILHLNITNRLNGSKIYVYDQGAIIEGHHLSQPQIQELLHAYSRTNRGEISSQISKMLKAIDNHKKGPFHFSGGTEAYHAHNLLMIYRQGMKNYDRVMARVLEKISDEELMSLPTFNLQDLKHSWENLLKMPDAMLSMPGLLLLIDRGSQGKTLNTSVYDSLFPELSAVVKKRNLSFISCLKCHETWKKKQKKLPEKLRLLPLWTLSNLFPSQE